MSVSRVVGVVGRVLIWAGALVLLFVVYELWGTGIHAALAQRTLESEFDRAQSEYEAAQDEASEQASSESTAAGDGAAASGDETLAAGPAPAPPPVGDAIGAIQIPEIGVDWWAVEGVSLTVLKDGPGHFPGTPMPGQAGNAAIAGHRTTYGAPFHNIDQLEPGDEISVTTLQGTFTYEMTEQRIVRPDEVEVLDDFGDNRITLIACNPKYSARERIVVVGELADGEETVAGPAPGAGGGGTEGELALGTSLDGASVARLPVFLSAFVVVLVWVAFYLLGRVWRRWPAYLLGAPVFLVALFVFFEDFARLLPSAY